MRLFCESMDVIRRSRERPTETFTIAIELSGMPGQRFTDEEALILAQEIKDRIANNRGEIDVTVNVVPVVRPELNPPTNWFYEHVLPDAGIAMAGYIQRHGPGQHDIRRTVTRLNSLHKRRQLWMLLKWAAYTVTGGVLATWAFVQLLDKFL